MQELTVDLKALESIIAKIFTDIKENRSELTKRDELVQSKELELIECNVKLRDLQDLIRKQELEPGQKAVTSRKDQDEREKKIQILQRDNAELIQGRIELLRNYNDLLVKHNELKEDHRKLESNFFELKHSIRANISYTEHERKPKKPHHTLSTVTPLEIGEHKEILDKIKGLLKVPTYGDVLVAVQKILKILGAVPQMESFIKEICNVVLGAEMAAAPQIEAVLPTLKKWKENIIALTEDLAFYREIVGNLQKMCGEKDPEKLFEALEGPYFLAWEMRPFVSVTFNQKYATIAYKESIGLG
eukprot:TRINITY_DN105036_c1_g1_i1.p2 TRINITY_DN105036_c1_g1~~TRINITY_DN105036_c1_g1_i1.p2  ORF type:complete len:302 (-),score=42.17 TRINITY_DN105036_c1_g1_i1:1555-2460(-)